MPISRNPSHYIDYFRFIFPASVQNFRSLPFDSKPREDQRYILLALERLVTLFSSQLPPSFISDAERDYFDYLIDEQVDDLYYLMAWSTVRVIAQDNGLFPCHYIPVSSFSSYHPDDFYYAPRQELLWNSPQLPHAFSILGAAYDTTARYVDRNQHDSFTKIDLAERFVYEFTDVCLLGGEEVVLPFIVTVWRRDVDLTWDEIDGAVSQFFIEKVSGIPPSSTRTCADPTTCFPAWRDIPYVPLRWQSRTSGTQSPSAFMNMIRRFEFGVFESYGLFRSEGPWLGVRDRASNKKVTSRRALVEDEGFRVLIRGGDPYVWNQPSEVFQQFMNGWIGELWVPDFAARCAWVQDILPKKIELVTSQSQDVSREEKEMRAWMGIVVGRE